MPGHLCPGSIESQLSEEPNASSLPMNKMLEEQVCKQNQQASFRCAEIAS
jgi:hypothetical protein